jgi:hypothetical protein
MCPKLSIKEK